MPYSVIIPSKTAANLVPCVKAIREAGETCRIIVVDDGVDWGGFRAASPQPCQPNDFLRTPPDRIIQGMPPFVFARNVNIGIQAAGDDDVILLNDDALLKTPMGFAAMATEAAHGFHGMIAAACNNVGNVNQHWKRHSPISEDHLMREEPRMVCFVCVYIPRSTIRTVGQLDERFVGYGMDDDDYSLRVRNAGLKLAIFDGCYVDHGSLTSSFRGGPQTGGDFRPNMKRFIEKWGVDNWGRDKAHSEFADLFPKEAK